MARRKIKISITVLSVAMLLAAAGGELLAEPTDPIFWWYMQWLPMYAGMLDPLTLGLIHLWVYYVLSAIWYLFVAAIALYLGRDMSQQCFALVSVASMGLVIGILFGQVSLPLPLVFEIGMRIFYGSVAVFVFLVAYVYWKIHEEFDEIEVS